MRFIAQASTGKLPDARHRAFALAEQLGIDAGIDRIESWSMDLRQSPSCDERRTAVIQAPRDRRFAARLPALRKARTQISVHSNHDLAGRDRITRSPEIELLLPASSAKRPVTHAAPQPCEQRLSRDRDSASKRGRLFFAANRWQAATFAR